MILHEFFGARSDEFGQGAVEQAGQVLLGFGDEAVAGRWREVRISWRVQKLAGRFAGCDNAATLYRDQGGLHGRSA